MKKIILLPAIILALFMQANAQWSSGGENGGGSKSAFIDNSGREVMFNYFKPSDGSRVGYGFNMALDWKLAKIPINKGIKEIRWQLGGALRLSFQSVNDQVITDFFSDTANSNKLTESLYTLYTPYLYTDIRIYLTRHIAIIPTAGYYYGFGSILWEDCNGNPKEGERVAIRPNPNGLMYGITLKIGPVGLSYKVFDDAKNFHKGVSLDAGLKF